MHNKQNRDFPSQKFDYYKQSSLDDHTVAFQIDNNIDHFGIIS